jgi:hypothetical protein
MDRVSVRSFRDPDLAVRGLKDLKRSRLDTGREVALQPIGERFKDAGQAIDKLSTLFREDDFYAPEGHFCRLDLRVRRDVADRLAALDPRAAERRLAEATRALLGREFSGCQGVYCVRFESTGDRLDPVVHAHLSCRLVDGREAPAMTREQTRALDDRWGHQVERAFGLSRQAGDLRDRGRTRSDGPSPERQLTPLRQEWARSLARLFAAYAQRLVGGVSGRELADTVTRTRAARATWLLQRPLPDLRAATRRTTLDEVRLRIEGGGRYFAAPLDRQRREILEDAAARAIGVADAAERRPAVVAWPVGHDLHGRVYFNQRSEPDRSPGDLDPALVARGLEDRLRDEICRAAEARDAGAEARRAELGSIEATPGRDREREAARPRPHAERQEHQAASLVVAFDAELARVIEGSERSGVGSRTPGDAEREERSWSKEQVFTVHLRIPTGAEQVERAGLAADEIAHVVQRAVDRAYPFLERESIRGNFAVAAHRHALDVRVAIPERLGWTADQLRSPQFQQRFICGFHQALAQIAPTRIVPEKERFSGLSRALGVAQAPMILRRFEQEPERAARDAAGAVFDKLTRVLPHPFRLMRELGRTVGRFSRND